MERNRSPIIRVMEGACREASHAIARDILEIEKLQVSRKGINDFVTASDIKAEKIIVRELMNARPHYGLILEESGVVQPKLDDGEYECTWIVDPIDGTSNFMHSNPNFAISVALRRRPAIKKQSATLSLYNSGTSDNLGIKDMVAGIVYLPMTNEMYWAEKGCGAYHVDQFGGESRLKISGRTNLSETLFSTIYCSLPSERYKIIYQILIGGYSKPRMYGSGAVDLAYLASGKVDVALYNSVMLWDVAAGTLIAQEAGASFRILHEDNNVSDDNPLLTGLLVSNGPLLMDILEKERRVCSGDSEIE